MPLILDVFRVLRDTDSISERLSWQIRMNDILTASSRSKGYDGSGKVGVLSPDEMDEMKQAYKNGETPEVFASLIEARDVSNSNGGAA